MADQTDNGGPPFQEADRDFEKGPAAGTLLSLSQALLAPLDAILKAQVHAARSFINLLLQIGYPHQPAVPSPPAQGTPGTGAVPGKPGAAAAPAASGTPAPQDGIPYQMDFFHDLPNGGRQKISIPTLALVPFTPLAVTDAEFTFDFYVRQLARHRQIQASEQRTVDQEKQQTQGTPEQADRTTRPWFLVDTPLSIQGTFAPSAPSAGPSTNETLRNEEAKFHIAVKVGALPLPAALEKMLTSLAQASVVSDVPPTAGGATPDPTKNTPS